MPSGGLRSARVGMRAGVKSVLLPKKQRRRQPPTHTAQTAGVWTRASTACCVVHAAELCLRRVRLRRRPDGRHQRATPQPPTHSDPAKTCTPQNPENDTRPRTAPSQPPQWPGVGPERGQHKAAGQRWLRETHTRNDPETIQRGAETRAASGSVAQATNPNTGRPLSPPNPFPHPLGRRPLLGTDSVPGPLPTQRAARAHLSI